MNDKSVLAQSVPDWDTILGNIRNEILNEVVVKKKALARRSMFFSPFSERELQKRLGRTRAISNFIAAVNAQSDTIEEFFIISVVVITVDDPEPCDATPFEYLIGYAHIGGEPIHRV